MRLSTLASRLLKLTGAQWNRQIETTYGGLKERLPTRSIPRVMAGSHKVLL
jgi:hypothetical protein